VHQVEPLEFDVLHTGQFDRPGIVHQRIDAAEMLVSLGQRMAHRVFITYIQLQRQGVAAGRFDFCGDAVDGARQFRMGFGALGRNHDIGPVLRGPQRNLTPDATAGAGDEQGFAL